MGTQADFERLVGLVADGALTLEVDETYPLEETGAAFTAMQDRVSVVNLIITP